MSVSALALLTLSLMDPSVPRSVLPRPHAVMASPPRTTCRLAHDYSPDKVPNLALQGFLRGFGSKFSSFPDLAESNRNDFLTYMDHENDLCALNFVIHIDSNDHRPNLAHHAMHGSLRASHH